MATVETMTPVQRIGETAGLVWQVLSDNGPQSLSKLVKQVDAPRDTVLQAIGWLAREDKLEFVDNGRTKSISLR